MANIIQSLRTQLVKIGNRMYGRAMSLVRGVFSLSQSEVFDNIDAEKAVKKGFNANTIVYVVAKKDAVKFGSIPRFVYSNAEREEKGRKHPLAEYKAFDKIDKGALTKLLNRPNPYQSQDLFFATVRAFYKICGEAFIWCNRGDITDYRLADGSFDDIAINKLPILEMYVLPSYMISIIPELDNPWGVAGYMLETTNRPVMRKDDVIHWKDLNLNWDDASLDQIRGMSPLTPGSKTLEESNSLSRASMRMAQNEGSKAVIFDKSMKKMSPEQETQMKTVIDRKVNNNEVAGSVAAIQGDWGMLDLAMSSKDMEMIDKKKMSWHEIALLFDLPPSLVVTDQKYDNAQAAMLEWVYNLIPALKQLDGEMNRVLLPAFNMVNKAFIASDVTDLPEVRKQMLEEAKILQELWCIPPNDVLEFLGYPRNTNPDFDEVWIPAGRTPYSEHQMNVEMDRELLKQGAGDA